MKRSTLLAEVSKQSYGLALQPELSDKVNRLLAIARTRGARKWDRCDVFAAIVFGASESEADVLDLIARYEAEPAKRPRVAAKRTPGRVPRRKP